MADSEDEHSGPAMVQRRATPGGGRRRAVSFVVLFLAITFTLLLGYREIMRTAAMSRYLFVIGQHVTAVLSLVGDECRLEGNIRAQQRGGLRAYRDEIAAWRRGEEAPWPPAESGPDEAPITPWENYLHRELSLRRELENAQQNLVKIRELAAAKPETATLASVEARLAAFKAVASHRMPDGSERLQGSGNIHQQVLLLDGRLKSLAANEGGDRAKNDAEIADIQTTLDTLIANHVSYLEKRIASYAQANEGMGPSVTYIHRAGLIHERERLQAIIIANNQAAAAGDTEAASRMADAQQRYDDIERRIREQPGPDSRVTKGYAFTFHIIPDCGALQSMIIYLAAVLAFPTKVWKRIVGALAGVPVLYAINIVRLSCLGIIGALVDDTATFDFYHEVVWQAIYLAFVIVVWLLWMELLVRPRRPKRASGAQP